MVSATQKQNETQNIGQKKIECICLTHAFPLTLHPKTRII